MIIKTVVSIDKKCKEYMKIELSKAFVNSYNLYINSFHCGYRFTGTLINSDDPDLSTSLH